MNAAANREPVVHLTIGEDVPDEHVENIKKSVATMARRQTDTTLAMFDRNTQLHERAQVLQKPVKDIVMADNDAEAAFALETAAQIDDPSSVTPDPAPDWPPVRVVREGTGEESDSPLTVFGAPYHFQWQWHNGNPPQTSIQDRPNGTVELWTHADQNANWSDCHGGFGLSLATNRVVQAVGRSLRSTNHWYLASGGSFGGNATVEGGCEMTALEGGTRLLSLAQDKRFRRRVSAGEEGRWNEPGFELGEGGAEVNWIMTPGKTYTFCCGAWVFGEAHGGLGTASIGSVRISAKIITMNLFQYD
jgi:hypothetical protein